MSTGSARVRLAVTLGDPRGVGPEITAALLARADLRETCEFTVIGPDGTGTPVQHSLGSWRRGSADLAAAGWLSGRAIEAAVRLAMSGGVDGIVTAPIDKFALREGGFDYPGHTEMLGALAGVETAMMLASEKLRVVLATTHIPLRDVAASLTREVIARAARITRAGLVDLIGVADPSIALCALNPHAGDGGRFGSEDAELLEPAARESGLVGPLPADTVFVRALRGEFDAVIAPYHDVGMTAIKVASFGSAVNITLGLPFPRCSPDHGTALDIAGHGIADPSSMIQAATMCAALVRRRSER